MPAARYQHGAVFVGPRLHISGGAMGGGRMVDEALAAVVLDTAAGMWCTQAPLPPASSASSPSSQDCNRRYVFRQRCMSVLHIFD